VLSGQAAGVEIGSEVFGGESEEGSDGIGWQGEHISQQLSEFFLILGKLTALLDEGQHQVGMLLIVAQAA
jgi:hypothetical protein